LCLKKFFSIWGDKICSPISSRTFKALLFHFGNWCLWDPVLWTARTEILLHFSPQGTHTFPSSLIYSSIPSPWELQFNPWHESSFHPTCPLLSLHLPICLCTKATATLPRL
jgi:hypothetical protein